MVKKISMNTLKVITVNTWGGRLLDSLSAFLKKENADIVFLQEVYNAEDSKLEPRFRLLSEFLSRLPYSYHAYAPTFLDTRSVGDVICGNAILSKFPITDQSYTPFDVLFGKYDEESLDNFEYLPTNMQRAALEFAGKTLNVFNVHGIWGFDGKDSERRMNMSNIIVKQILGKENVIMGGDFNLLPNTKTIANIEKHVESVFKNQLTSTFNMAHKDKPGYAVSAVDMIFVSPNIKVLEHYMSMDDVSDHRPLVCKLAM